MKQRLLFVFLFFIGINKLYSQNVTRGVELYKACIQCHGSKGMGSLKQSTPRISGQHDWYILTSLRAFKNQKRKNIKMYSYIKNLTDKDFQDLSAYIAQMK